MLVLKLLAFCLVPLAALSADRVMTGPLAGYVLDTESRTVRPVLGIPGAAYMGGAILENVDALAVSPDGDQALVSGGGSLVLVRRLPDGGFETAPVEGARSADKLAWSPDGSAAVGYSSATRAAQILTGGKFRHAVDLSALERVSAFAIDNSGDTLLAGAEGGLYLAARSGNITLIAAVARPVAIALAGADAFVVAGGVFEIKDYASKASVVALAVEPGAIALQTVREGKRLIVAGARSVSVYDVASRTVSARLDLEFAPTMLSHLGSGTAFALNADAESGEPLYVVDVGREPAVFFVPGVRGRGIRQDGRTSRK